MCIYIYIYIYGHSWTTPSRPLDGRGVLVHATFSGAHILPQSGVGACIDVHVNLQMKYMLRFGCRQVQGLISWVGWGGMGWGIYERSCELADEVHAMLWLPAGACIHWWADGVGCRQVGWGGVGHVLTFM